MPSGDRRPYLALAAVLGVVALAFLVPASRSWLLDVVVAPLRAQADPEPGLRVGYSLPSLLFWAGIGAAFAWAVYDAAFVRAKLEPNRDFFLALAPALLLGPMLHAALVERVLPEGSVLAYLAAEPVVYLTTAAFAAIGLALGRLASRPVLLPLVWGALGLAPLLVLLLPLANGESLAQASALLALSLAPAALLAFVYVKFRPGDTLLATGLVIWAHALDGATTWMVLRDPFGLGFTGYGERNPVSETLVNLSNGWPYFALKLALPLVLLSLVKAEEAEEKMRAFLLFAVFVLGFGPGMANLLQVAFG